MEVITRTEFDEAMRVLVTKEDLQTALADTKSEIVDVIKSEFGRASLQTKVYVGEEISRAKLEILSVNKKNIADAIAPLATKAELQEAIAPLKENLKQLGDGQVVLNSKVNSLDARVNSLDARVKTIGENIDKLAMDMAEGFEGLGQRPTVAGG